MLGIATTYVRHADWPFITNRVSDLIARSTMLTSLFCSMMSLIGFAQHYEPRLLTDTPGIERGLSSPLLIAWWHNVGLVEHFGIIFITLYMVLVQTMILTLSAQSNDDDTDNKVKNVDVFIIVMFLFIGIAASFLSVMVLAVAISCSWLFLFGVIDFLRGLAYAYRQRTQEVAVCSTPS
jgi:hypothetical protein